MPAGTAAQFPDVISWQSGGGWLANKGYRRALLEDRRLRNGLNIVHGRVTNTNRAVGQALGYKYVDPSGALQS
jgi:alanine dehydrogenase